MIAVHLAQLPQIYDHLQFKDLYGFNNNNDLMLFVEEKFKMERNLLIRNNIEDPCELVNSGNTIIQNLYWQVYQNVQSSDLSSDYN